MKATKIGYEGWFKWEIEQFFAPPPFFMIIYYEFFPQLVNILDVNTVIPAEVDEQLDMVNDFALDYLHCLCLGKTIIFIFRIST